MTNPEHGSSSTSTCTFRNGGGLQGQGFRLDIPGDDITDAEAGALLVRELGLLMVDQVRITGRRILVEPHRRRAGGGEDGTGAHRLVELSHRSATGWSPIPGCRRRSSRTT